MIIIKKNKLIFLYPGYSDFDINKILILPFYPPWKLVRQTLKHSNNQQHTEAD